MVYRNFDQILEAAQKRSLKPRVAVAGAADDHVIEAVLNAHGMGMIRPVFIGSTSEIQRLIEKKGGVVSEFPIIEAGSNAECGELAVKLTVENQADFIMKGMIDTRDVLKPLVRKENGLHMGRTMTHVAIDQIPGMDRLIALTDGGMVPYPTLEEKRDIIENAVDMFRSFGYETPSVAVLCAVEKVNPKQVETTDAAALVEMNRSGLISNCHVVGPISYDIAMNAEIAAAKNYDCAFCGQFDILVVPTMVAGNLLNKSLTVSAGALMAGVILGAKVPVAVTSRSSSVQEKLLSLALASLIVKQ